MQVSRLVLAILAILVTFSIVVDARMLQKCNHDEIKAKLELEELPNEPQATSEQLSVDNEKKRRLQGTPTTFQPIRISYDLAGLKGLDAAKYDIIVNQVLPAAKQVFASFVNVLPLQSNLTINGSKCYQASIDSKYNTQGIANTDLLIFVTYDTTTTNLLAWATACVLSSKNNHRPIAGQINFAALNLQSGLYEFQEVLKTVIHEMIHVLVFSPSLFNYYVNPNGTVKTNSLKPATVRGVNTTLVTLPTILNWVRKHINCSTIAGAELENQGTSASKGAHWERRVFGNELMTSSLSHDAVLSNLTMNLFEESGWYVVDRSKAGDLQYGKNQGCNFVDGACIENKKSQFPGQFCDTVNVETCSPSYRSKAACPIGKFGMDIPSAMNYFNDGQSGTNDMFADNCPMIMNTNTGDCTDPSNFQVSNSKFFEEVYGGASRCFSGNFIKEGAARSGYNTFNHGTCLKSKCQSGTLTVFLGDQVIVCPVAGGPVTVPGYRGTFNCPAAADFCYNAFDQMCGVHNCGGVGLCVAGKCYCPPGVDKAFCDPTWTAATDIPNPIPTVPDTPAVPATNSTTNSTTNTATNITKDTPTGPASTSTSTNTNSNTASNTNSNGDGTNSTASSLLNDTSNGNATISFAPIANTAKSGSILGSILCSSLFVIFLSQFLL